MMTNQVNGSNNNQSNQTTSQSVNGTQTVTNSNQTQSQASSILITSIPSLTATASAIAATSTSSTPSNSESAIIKVNNNGTALIEMIMCKLVTPFHVINDPRLLECGSSACLDCIMSIKDNDRNLKCPYCNNIHKIPVDTSKLISNKNLQTFLKINFADLNQNFNKQLEDSMFALEQKIQTQNMAMENFDNYLTLVQNDVQMKIENMKNQLEKYAEQFLDSIKVVRKEVQKQWNEHSSPTFASPTSINTANSGNILITTNQNLLNINTQQLQPQIQITKDKTYQIIGIKNESLIPGNLNVLTLLNSNNPLTHSTYQLTNTFTTTSSNNSSSNSTPTSMTTLQTANPQTIQQAQTNQQANSTNLVHHQSHNDQNINNNSNNLNNLNKQRNNQNLINNSNKTTLLQHNDALNTSLDVLTNTFNFSNSSSWNGNEDDLEDFETEINLKPVPTNLTASSGSNANQKRHLNKEQAQFNKFVRDEVSKKFGEDFLLQHEVNQLESSIMELIKTEAISSFLPKDTTPARAWTLAKVSLRSLKRDLRRKQGLSNKKESHEGKMRNKLNFSYNNQI
ncbi:unnamed protein product [Brachionus calyciflorus]|uniref:Uncharacterized protein n=1 Tax=Brachionus calyciflorus TaxID=104777 RepID=A0A813LZP2_9BILA|nr:unnamed protein product [Brachionus calyciflorus]